MVAESVVVVGSSSATLTADIAEISVGLTAAAPTVGQALAEVAASSRRVFDAAAEHGIDTGDWYTERVSTGTRVDGTTMQISEYTAEHWLRLTLGSVTTAPTVLGAVSRVAEDSLRLGGLALTSPDAEALRSRLAVEAVTDARRRAQQLADAAGVGLGGVRSIVEEGARNPSPRAAEAMVWMEEQQSVRQSGSVPLQAGADRVTVRVFVTFDLEPLTASDPSG